MFSSSPTTFSALCLFQETLHNILYTLVLKVAKIIQMAKTGTCGVVQPLADWGQKTRALSCSVRASGNSGVS